MTDPTLPAKSIFYKFLQEQPANLDEFLDRLCQEDTNLRTDVEELIHYHAKPSTFLDNPIFSPAHDTSKEAGSASIHGRDSWHLDPFEAPPERIGPYILGRLLGHGGMGVVYLARHAELNREVALKIALAGTRTEDKQRFRAEAEAVAGLDHPNVVTVYEVGAHEGTPYFTLEFCPAGSLEALSRRGPIPPRQCAELLEQVARGVAAAHAQGIVHRDLKPANILLDSGGRPKVTDFGLAKKSDAAGLTASGMLLGTPTHMAPEQASGMRVGPAADVWALGVIFYELLTCKLPFAADDAISTLRLVSDSEPEPLRALQAQVPRDLEVICLKCLQKDPAGRYVSADALADDLRRWLDGHPILARPAPWIEQAWKWVGRNPAASATAVFLTAGIAVSSLFAVRAEQARQVAETARQAALADRAAKDRARDDASRAREATESYGEFLESDFLGAARPRGLQGGLGVDVTVADALEHSEKTIPERFAGKPLAEARARHAIGVTWRNLGRYADAEANLRRAIELRRESLGEDDARTLSSCNSLCATLLDAGQTAAAIPLLEDTLRRQQAVLGELDPVALKTQDNLAGGYQQAGRLADAVALYETVYQARRRVLGERHPETLESLGGLAVARAARGQIESGLGLLERASADLKAELGERHAETLLVQHNLAQMYANCGRARDAVPLFEKTIASIEGVFGKDHPRTIECSAGLADALICAGRIREAIRLLELAVAQAERVLGKRHLVTQKCRTQLAIAYSGAGRAKDALSLIDTAVREEAEQLGEDHPSTLKSRGGQAQAYLMAGRLEAAITLLTDARGRSESALGTRHPTTLGLADLLANALVKDGRHDDAIAILEQTLADSRQVLGEQHRGTLRAANDLAVAYAAAKRFHAAHDLLQETLNRTQEQLGDAHIDTVTTRFNFAYVLEHLGRLTDAIGEYERAYAGLVRLEFQHPYTQRIQSYMLTACEKAGLYAKQEPVLRDRLRLLEEAPSSAPATITMRKVELGLCLVRQEKFVAAETLLRPTLLQLNASSRKSWLLAENESLLGAALLGQKQYEEAEPLLLRGYDGLKEAFQSAPPPLGANDQPGAGFRIVLLQRAAFRLADLLDATGRREEAARWRARHPVIKPR